MRCSGVSDPQEESASADLYLTGLTMRKAQIIDVFSQPVEEIRAAELKSELLLLEDELEKLEDVK